MLKSVAWILLLYLKYQRYAPETAPLRHPSEGRIDLAGDPRGGPHGQHLACARKPPTSSVKPRAVETKSATSSRARWPTVSSPTITTPSNCCCANSRRTTTSSTPVLPAPRET